MAENQNESAARATSLPSPIRLTAVCRISPTDGKIGDEPNNSTKCSEVANGVTTKRRDRPISASMLWTTRCIDETFLIFAYDCCRANGGAPGVEGQTFEDIEEYGVGKWLDELAQELRSRTYQSRSSIAS
jgi:hypothetical protein